MEENNLFHDRYFLERLLGRGNFSEVWLAKDSKTDIPVALKIYAPATGLDDQGLNVFAREFSLVVNANHKNLLKPMYYDSCDRKPYLVLPFCKNGSIMKDIGVFTEEQAWKLLRDVASGLAWLHGMNPPVIHQDIKPDNIMVGENGEYMITDFGVSTHLKSTLRKSLSSAFSSAGTIAYMAPERFGKDNTPIMANDVYSLGATVYEMLSGDTPFGNDGGLVQKKGADIPELKGNFSSQLKKTLSKCLRLNPWERPTAEQLAEYAETAIKGEKIKFVDEKTSWKKYKIVGGCILFAIIASLLVLAFSYFSNTTDKRTEEEKKEIKEIKIQKVNTVSPTVPQKQDSIAETITVSKKTQKKTKVNREVKGKDVKSDSKTEIKQSKQKEAEPVSLSVSEQVIKFKSKGGSRTIKITCNYPDWKVVAQPEWISCSTNGENELVCEASKNPEKSERQGMLVVECRGSKISIGVLQSKKGLFR